MYWQLCQHCIDSMTHNPARASTPLCLHSSYKAASSRLSHMWHSPGRNEAFCIQARDSWRFPPTVRSCYNR